VAVVVVALTGVVVVVVRAAYSLVQLLVLVGTFPLALADWVRLRAMVQVEEAHRLSVLLPLVVAAAVLAVRQALVAHLVVVPVA
jgi:hypothetical protein